MPKQRGAVLRLFAFLLLSAGVSAAVTAAPLFVEEVQLDFGELAVPDNAAPVKTIRIPVAGQVDADVGIIQVSGPARGQYRLSGFPPNTRISVSASNASLTAGGLGRPPLFTFTDLASNEPLTDDFGNADLIITGSLETSATKQGYPDAPYEGTAIIELSYWSPKFERVVPLTEVIDLKVRVSTALDLTELDSLRFGRISAATGTTGDQAELVLAPDGSYAVKSATQARIVPLNGQAPATILVEGAAALYDLEISVQASPVFLTHQNLPGAPKFEVTDFTTLPAGTGRTDRDGQLEIQVGATLKTEETDFAKVYPEGNYSGSYNLTVQY